MIPYKGRIKPQKEENKVNPKTHPLPPLDRGGRTRLPAPHASPSAQGKHGRRFGIYIALSILLLVTGAGWGQGNGWKWLAGGELRGVRFIGNNGWIFGYDGSQGLILHTTDGGYHWDIQPHNTGYAFSSVADGMYFVDEQNGWIAGGSQGIYPKGFILRTRDGGRTWVFSNPPDTTWSLFSIWASDTMHLWLISRIDTIYRTTDGGSNWQKSPADQQIYGICFVDSLTGCAVSSYGILEKTTDGGVTWVRRTGFPSQQYAIEMSDTLKGWAGGDPASVVTTNDGWTTWTQRQIGGAGYIADISFKDAQNGLMAGYKGIYKTTDGGTSWRWDSLITADFKGIDAKQLPIAWAVSNGSAIVKTTNGGDTWEILRDLDSPPPYGAYSSELLSVNFCDANNGWASSAGVLYHTTNGGTIWRRQTGLANSNWIYGVDAADQDHVWACDASGRIYGSTNGGTTWVFQDTAGGMLRSISFADTLVGVAVGGGTIGRPPHAYRVRCNTADGGRTWQKSGMQIDQQPLYGVWFVNKTKGWACGGAGTVLLTTDGGITWAIQPTNTGDHLYGIAFSDSLHGLACGWAGRVVWTNDGGTNWNSGNSATTQILNSCALADTSHGFAVGGNGLIVQTTDGGRNWFPDTSNVHTGLHYIFALDSTHVWTVGYYGMVLGWGEAGNTGIETRGQGEGETRKQETALGQSYPNPTRGIASFEYELGKAGKVRVRVYNVTGQAVRTLVEGLEPSGRHVVIWDGRDEAGRKAGSGTYFYCLEAGERKAVRKMVVVR